jgi:hypothetical protein
MPSKRPSRVSPGLALTVAAVVFAAVVWFALGMHRGLLLSSDILTVRYPWAALFADHRVQTPVLADPVHQFVPWLQFSRRELLAGRLPLWNPHQDGGVPLLGNGQSALLSPLVWPVLAFGIAEGWNLSLLARVLLAALATYLWLRAAARSRIAAGFGALVFSLSGPFIAWLEHPPTMVAAAFPLLLWSIERHARNASPRSVVVIALSSALVLVNGHPPTALMVGILAAARLVFVTRGWRPVVSAAIGGLAGFGLAAPALLPFGEYMLESQALRGIGRTPFVIEAAALIRFLRPQAPVGHVIEAAAFVSITALVLAALSLTRAVREREPRFWVFAVVTLGVVIYDNPLGRVIAHVSIIHWSRWLLLMPLAVAWLSTYGLDQLRPAVASRWGQRISVSFAAALALVAGLELVAATRGVHGVTDPRLVDLSTPLLERLRQDHSPFRVLPLGPFLPPNFATAVGIDDVRGYDTITPRRWRERRETLGAFRNDMIAIDRLKSGGRALNEWNIRYILAFPSTRERPDEPAVRQGLNLVEVYAATDGRIWENRAALPRVRLASGANVTIEERTPTRWTLSLTAAGDDMLTLADPFFPGWRVWLDGREVTLGLTVGDPIVVPVPAGEHEVVVAYRPRSLTLGLLLAAFSTLCLLSAATLPSRRLTTS